MITGVQSVVLRVDDLDAATAFYRDVVGLEDAGGGLLLVPGGPAVVELSDAGVSGPAPRRASGLFHTAFRFPARADLAAALRRVASRSHLTGASDHGVSEALYLDDPSGNGVELYWDRDRSLWPEEMYTAPLDLQDLAAAGGEATRAPEGTDVGHVHLKVSDLDRAVDFWHGELGFDVMARWRTEAAFLATGGYHHHVGLNTWLSLGAEPGPRELAGLERVVFRATEAGESVDPDGIRATLVAE